MAGTDTSRSAFQDPPLAPVIILVAPQLGENIGMCARAMLNCAVTELRLVSPRDGWPNPAAVSAASGAASVLDAAKIYGTTKEAVADLEYVLATTARGRDMVKPVLPPEIAAQEIRSRHRDKTAKCGILFGPERTGLENDDIALADAILNIPLNPGFSSLNLAQAVLLVCFSWLTAENPFALAAPPAAHDAAPAAKGEIELLLAHIEDELSKGGFFRSPAQKPTLIRNIRNFFFRAAPTLQEVRTLHGVVSCLTGKRSWTQGDPSRD